MENDLVEEKNEHMVFLPCKPEDFGSFISGLLGKPQTITNHFQGSYELNKDEISNLYKLISQRVAQQNPGSLIQFTIKIVFDDKSSVLLNSFEDFESYSEIKPQISTQVHLSWSFLMQFQDRKHPEKQEIKLSFITANGHGLPIYDEDEPAFMYIHELRSGHISFAIKHTARTWGTDIESLLSGHIKNLIEPATKSRKFSRKHSAEIGFGISALFFIASLTGCFYTASVLWKHTESEIEKLLSSGIKIDEKIDFILHSSSNGLWSHYFFSVIIFIVFSLVISIFLGIWAGSTANTHKPSFILLTKKSVHNKTEQIQKYTKKWYSFLLSIFTSILTGIATNLIFSYFWGNNLS